MKLQAIASMALLHFGAYASDVSHGPTHGTSIHTSNDSMTAAVTSPTEMHPVASTSLTATRTKFEADDRPTEIYNLVARGGIPGLESPPIETSGLGAPPIPVIEENLLKAVKGVDSVCDECASANYDCGCDKLKAQPARNTKEAALLAKLDYARLVVKNWCYVCKETKLDCECVN